MTAKGKTHGDHHVSRGGVAAFVASVVLGSATLGCDTDWEVCAELVTCAPPVEVACNDTPGAVDRPGYCEGIYVSPRGRDEGSGLWSDPVRTFSQAFDLAKKKKEMRVYASADVFRESVSVPSGMEVWGGLLHEDHPTGPWPLPVGITFTTLDPGPDTIPLTVGEKGDEPDPTALTKITRLNVIAQSATVSGGSSIAMVALRGVTVELHWSKLLAGDGNVGERGADGGADGGEVSALAGAPGNPGAMACSADTVSGGQVTVTACDDGDSSGGRGGAGRKDLGDDGEDGAPLPATNPQQFGLGGLGQQSIECTDGHRGRSGDEGAYGKGAVGPGRITADGVEGVAGADGHRGQHGYGGGGGGGSRGGFMFCGANGRQGGASGGSGGAGGCGGKPGKGGGPGGSSIGILSYHATVRVLGTRITTGRGGHGGPGGTEQFGGVGGYGGVGGLRPGGSLPGCRGGDGGTGGNGGQGGGGLGGHSIGIAHSLNKGPEIDEDSPIKFEAPGDGGGSGDLTANSGDRGESGFVVGFQD